MPHDDSSSSGSKTPRPHDSRPDNYFSSISPSSQSPVVSIPSQGLGSGLRQRRSSITLGLDQLRHAGGVNSIDAFARSWTRAAGYFEITPAHQSYVSIGSHDDDEEVGESAFSDDDDTDQVPSEYTNLHHTGPNYGAFSSFGMPAERLNDSVTRHATDLYIEQQEAMKDPANADKEREPLLIKIIEDPEGQLKQIIVGQSTLPQTVFNSVNVLIGVGLLSLPLGLKYSGWLVGMIFLAYSAIVTNYTAKLLARCLEKSPNQALVTYSDIAFLAFGHRTRIFVSMLFSIELIAACVALVVLFADTLHELIPGISITGWKIIAGFVLTPLNFLPLRVLSFTSILGIISTVSIFLIVVFNGLLKTEFPGSLLDPAPTYIFPQNWLTLPLSFGLLMSPWGGHSVFPNIFKDMRHPQKYDRAVNITYWFTYLLDASMMIVGILMFGDDVKDEITANILALVGAPEGAKVAMVVFIAIIPLTKAPLNARPIIATFELMMGVDPRTIALPVEAIGMSSFNRGLVRIAIRILTNITFVLISIVCPSFDRIMAFLGSALCFSICVILPLLFYLKIYGDEVSRKEKIVDWVLVVISSILAIIGTVFTFIPKESLGIVPAM